MSNSQPSESKEEVKLCDPCHWKIYDKTTKKYRECKWVGRALRAHVKVHKIDIKEYQRKFPNADIGVKMYVPPKENVDKWRKAGIEARGGTEDNLAPTQKEKQQRGLTDLEKEIDARCEELWLQVARDPTAKVFCRQAAEDEKALERLREEYRQELNLKKGDKEKLNGIGKAIGDVMNRYQSTMKNLELTVAERRKANTLGNDTVSQLISNFAGTKRKWSPERQQAFLDRVTACRVAMMDRIRRTGLLGDENVPDASVQESEPELDDFDKAILAFGKRVPDRYT